MRGNVIIPYVVLDQNTVAAKQFLRRQGRVDNLLKVMF